MHIVKSTGALVVLALLALLFLAGCSSKSQQLLPALTSPDVLIIRHHIERDQQDIEEFCRRLYLKNPIYEADIAAREQKLATIFPPATLDAPVPTFPGIADYANLPSHKLLEAAFSPNPPTRDRVLLLAIGMHKSIAEGYDGYDKRTLFSGIQLSTQKLENLYANICQLSWRLKTYHNPDGSLIFLTNAVDASGYINMGYEVLLTRILTRTADDIFMRNGQTPNFIFTMSTMFLPLLL
ncbi:MAG: hypothetical protein RBR22_07270 [Desulfuromonas sp.]|nr:hypothetical protein [Desulfuromonas sp.]